MVTSCSKAKSEDIYEGYKEERRSGYDDQGRAIQIRRLRMPLVSTVHPPHEYYRKTMTVH